MKVKKRDTVEMVVIFTIMISIIIFLSGCTHTFYKPPLDIPQVPDTPYKYYVIDEYSDTPDAYFETKEEAEKYKKYFQENHDYKIVQLR